LLAAAGNAYNNCTTTPATPISLGTSKSKSKHTYIATSSASNRAKNQKFHALKFCSSANWNKSTQLCHTTTAKKPLSINQHTLKMKKREKGEEQQTKMFSV